MAGVYISVCSHAEESPSVWNVLGRGKSFVFWPSFCLQLILRLLRTRLHSALLFFDVESFVLRADVLCLFTLQKIKVEDSAQ